MTLLADEVSLPVVAGGLLVLLAGLGLSREHRHAARRSSLLRAHPLGDYARIPGTVQRRRDPHRCLLRSGAPHVCALGMRLECLGHGDRCPPKTSDSGITTALIRLVSLGDARQHSGGSDGCRRLNAHPANGQEPLLSARSLARQQVGGGSLNAMRLESHYTKKEILEFYANQFHVSSNGRGLGIAARYFFDKEVPSSTSLECAFLAGLVKAPARYNPFIGRTAEAPGGSP